MMTKNRRTKSFLATILLTATCNLASAEDTPGLETGILLAAPGNMGNRLGAKVLTIEDENSQGTFIHIDVPVNPKKIYKVEVYDKHGQKIPQISNPDIIKDHEDNRVGVKLHLDRKRGFEFRLRFIDALTKP